jgi:glyoxalase family protein
MTRIEDTMTRPDTPLTGIHHVSAITANAQGNVDFYTQVLGLRLIKKTVNQDDVSVYHLFYTDAEGAAGTDITFFDIPNAGSNHPGSGEISEIAFRVPAAASLGFWAGRLAAIGVDHDAPRERYGRQVLTFRDPEGQRLALIADGDDAPIPAGKPWPHPGIPEEHAIVGLAAISTTTARPHATLPVLTDVMGFRVVEEIADPDNPNRKTIVLETGEGGPNALYYLHVQPDAPRARLGRGGVHHVAFRTPDAERHAEWREYVGSRGLNITPEIDRFYFLAAYFREPGGVLFELSSDGPGFTTDQSQGELGVELALPPFLLPYRDQIAAGLHPLDTSRERTSKDAAETVIV